MKNVFVIGILLLLLTWVCPVVAEALPQGGTHNESCGISLALHQKVSGDLLHPAPFKSFYKVRSLRHFAGLFCGERLPYSRGHKAPRHSPDYLSPFYPPLQRLLLFPNHYFW